MKNSMRQSGRNFFSSRRFRIVSDSMLGAHSQTNPTNFNLKVCWDRISWLQKSLFSRIVTIWRWRSLSAMGFSDSLTSCLSYVMSAWSILLHRKLMKEAAWSRIWFKSVRLINRMIKRSDSWKINRLRWTAISISIKLHRSWTWGRRLRRFLMRKVSTSVVLRFLKLSMIICWPRSLKNRIIWGWTTRLSWEYLKISKAASNTMLIFTRWLTRQNHLTYPCTITVRQPQVWCLRHRTSSVWRLLRLSFL